MSNTTVFLDVDGVLLDYADAFLRWLYRTNKTWDANMDEPIHVSPGWLSEYNLEKTLSPWMAPQLVRPAMNEFCGSDEWRGMPPLADIRLLEALRNCGIKLQILSSCWPEWQPDSLLRLTKHYGPVFTGCKFCPPQDKANFIRQYMHKYNVRTGWFLEDSVDNLISVLDCAPVTGMLINHPYNLTDTRWNTSRYANTNDALMHILKKEFANVE